MDYVCSGIDKIYTVYMYIFSKVPRANVYIKNNNIYITESIEYNIYHTPYCVIYSLSLSLSL